MPQPPHDDDPTQEESAESEQPQSEAGAGSGGDGRVVEPSIDFHGGRVDDLLIEDDLKKSYLTYAMSVIVSRALPDARDGLKPSQRRILVSMNDLNLSPRAKYRKCALIVGDCMGKYHPHGDMAIYPTLARMAQDWNTRYLLVEGQGNFGSVNPDPPAAMRYTEARMRGPTMEMLEDLDKKTVDFIENYDESRKEPTVLPGKFPNLVVNGSQGIAVGMATSIPPHNLREVADALIHMIENPECSVRDIMGIITGPDFPTGATICGRQGIEDAYLRGRGRLVLRAKYHYEEEKDREHIVIDEIPYQVGIQRLVDRIVDAVKGDRIVGIHDVRDETNKEGIRIVIELKRGQNREVVLNQLFKYTPLEHTFSVISLALVRGRPRVLNIKQLLEQYLAHRQEVIIRRTKFLLAEAEKEEHRLEGLIRAIDHIDDIITIIRGSETVDSARDRLMEKYEFSHRQATHILNMALRTLTGLAREQLKEEYQTILEQIRDFQDILTNHYRVLDIMKEDLYELKERYGDERRTTIVGEAGDLSVEDLVADEVMAVTVSHKGFLKREPLSSYRVQARGGKGIIGSRTKDEDDFPEFLFVASTHDYLLFFTSDGRVYWQKVYDVPQLGRMAQGRAIVNLLELAPEQKVVSVVPVRDFKEDASIAMVSQNGYIKKCALSEYGNPRRGGISTMKIDEGDQLLAAHLVRRQQEIVLATRLGMAVRFEESIVRDMGRTARGLKGPSLAEKDSIISMVVGSPGDFLLTVCKKGVGKRTQIESYRKTKTQRSKGVINIKITEKNGPVVAVLPVKGGDELMVMTESGKVIRSPIEDVRETGRAAVGVILVDLSESDQVTAVARVAQDDAESAHVHAAALKAEAEEEVARMANKGGSPDTPPADSGPESEITSGEAIQIRGEDVVEKGEPAADTAGDSDLPQGELLSKPEERPEQVNELLRRAERDAGDEQGASPEDDADDVEDAEDGTANAEGADSPEREF